MIRNIVQWPSKTLTTPTDPVSDPSSEATRALAEDLIDTCEAVGGLGLAAPQIGVNQHIAVLNLDHLLTPLEEDGEMPGYLTMVNPKVVFEEGEQMLQEGCLSVPKDRAWVKRPSHVAVEYTDLEGVAQKISGDGLLAVALLHEIDHLNGTVYCDHLPQFKRSIMRKRQLKLRKKLRKAGFQRIPVPGAEKDGDGVEAS